MHSKIFIFISILILAILGCKKEHNPIKDEEWSQPVEGIRGRLVLTRGDTFNGTLQIQVYLELQNVSDIANPVRILNGHSFTFDLTDSNGKNQPPFCGPVDILMPNDTVGLVLPYKSTLRFLVSVSGVGIPKDKAAQISVPYESGHTCWIIEGGKTSLYFLSGTFKATAEQGGHQIGKIVIALPKVQVPI
jgi:hypothetical protein